MPDTAVLHSGRAVGLVGTDVIAKVSNNGADAILLGHGNVTEDNFERKLEAGESAVLKGPLSGLAFVATTVVVESDADALRAEAKQEAPAKKPSPAKAKAAEKKTSPSKTRKR